MAVRFDLQDYKDLQDLLTRVRDRFGTLDERGLSSDIAASGVISGSLSHFNHKWKDGHYQTKKNIKTTLEALKYIIESFEGTDKQLQDALRDALSEKK
ncbi:hypothetical protein Afil01_59900 [Actinorhabdospora filicis]|uniref:Uncharacterized protein n=1 Tax=Actinorhabdospora filicis TaxID=1785913 RepID=A0A9W6SRT8_9ACTN|nr:hypothetical protein [Actinorhabdospora filicis]GLZ81183.1 hypothetical protein Afil01_59900 [Actinorhabdospora filicis]